jgi:hypothetical protein
LTLRYGLSGAYFPFSAGMVSFTVQNLGRYALKMRSAKVECQRPAIDSNSLSNRASSVA